MLRAEPHAYTRMTDMKGNSIQAISGKKSPVSRAQHVKKHYLNQCFEIFFDHDQQIHILH